MRNILTVIVLAALLCIGVSCVDADAKVGVVGERLTKLVDQNMSLSNKIDNIETLTQSLKQQFAEKVDILHKDIRAGTINYSGAGWAVLGVTIIVLIFLLAGIGIVFVLLRNASRFRELLTLVTTAIKSAPSDVSDKVKEEIEKQTCNGGMFGNKHKQMLREFTEKVGTFVTKEQ